MKPCVYCETLTNDQCIECGDAHCSTHATLLCPMCRRIKLFKAEQAFRRCVVPWQYPQAMAGDTSLLLSVGVRTDPGAVTIPIPKVVVW